MTLVRALQTLSLTAGLAFTQLAHAAIVPSSAITYLAQPSGGGAVAYTYTIDTTGLPVQFDQLTLYFEADLYASVSILDVPAAWDAIVVERDLSLDSDGFFDVLFGQAYAQAVPLVGTFTLQVQPVGAAAARAQYFNLLRSDTTTVIAEGFTTPATPVPEPASHALVLLALLAAGRLSRAAGQPASGRPCGGTRSVRPTEGAAA